VNVSYRKLIFKYQRIKDWSWVFSVIGEQEESVYIPRIQYNINTRTEMMKVRSE
jgi:hypothetical protein